MVIHGKDMKPPIRTGTVSSLNDISCPQHKRLNGHVAPKRKTDQEILLQDELCSHEDRGTCGNACCTIQAVAKGCDVHCAMAAISNTIKENDNGITLKNVTSLKEIGFTQATDITYLISAWRTDADGRIQNMQFSVGSSDLYKGESVIKGFSESKKVGGYRDYGQNYRNLVEIFRRVGEKTPTANSDNSWAANVVLIHGCGRNGLIREQSANVLLIGAGTIGIIIGGVVAVALQLCGNTEKKRTRRRLN
jgi:hypothetical protein